MGFIGFCYEDFCCNQGCSVRTVNVQRAYYLFWLIQKPEEKPPIKSFKIHKISIDLISINKYLYWFNSKIQTSMKSDNWSQGKLSNWAICPKVVVITFFLTLLALFTYGQEPIVILGGAGYAEQPKDHNILKAPVGLPDVSTYNVCWEKILDASLNSFELEYKNYSGKVNAAYSIFSLGNYSPFEEFWPREIITKVAYKIFSSPVLRELVYIWVRPYYIDAFDEMHYKNQIQYINLLKSADTYLKEFNYKDELRDLKADEKGFAQKKGKLNAFLFRRIYNKQISLGDCREWISRLLNEFGSYLKDSNSLSSQCDEFTAVKGDNYLCGMYTYNGFNGRTTRFRLYDPYYNLYDLPAFDRLIELKADDLYVLKDGEFSAVATAYGKLLTEFKYLSIFDYNDYGLAPVTRKFSTRDYVVLDHDVEYTDITPPYGNMIKVGKKGDTIFDTIDEIKWGFINLQGTEVIPAVYYIKSDKITQTQPEPPYEVNEFIMFSGEDVDFNYGVEIMMKDGFTGLIDTNGNEVIPFENSYIEFISFAQDRDTSILMVNKGGTKLWNKEQYTFTIEGGKWAVFSTTGKNLSGFIYDKLEWGKDEWEGKLYFRRKGIEGYIDKYGQEKR